jgi:Arc/MetJ family transcription regulator
MKRTLNIDDKLLKEAMAASGAKTLTDAVKAGLEELVRRAAYQRLAAMMGSEPGARDVPRRREAPARKRRAA